MPKYQEEYKGYRIVVYSPGSNYAVITPPGGNAVIDFGSRQPRSTIVEGVAVCVERAQALIDELAAEVSE